MTDEVQELRKIAHPLKSYWLEYAEDILREPLGPLDSRGLEYLSRNGGDPKSDCSEWAGAKHEGYYTGVDIATRVRDRIVFDFADRLSKGEYRAIGSVVLADAKIVHAEIPPDAFSKSTLTSGFYREPADAIRAFTDGKLNAFSNEYFDIRVVSTSEVEEDHSRRARGGRKRAIPELETYVRELAASDPEFPGKNKSEAARQLQEFVRTKRGVLSKDLPMPGVRTFMRAIDQVYPSNDKT